MSVTTEQEQVVSELRAADKLLLTTHENPDGDALGSLLAMHGILEQLGKDSRHVHVARRVPAAVGVPLAAARRGARHEPAAGRRGAHDRLPRLRQHRSHAGRLPAGRRPARAQHRPPPRQHPLRDGEPRLLGRVLHRRDGVADRQGARCRDHAEDRRRALRRPRDRHGPVHVREHDRRGSPDGRGADRSGRPAAHGLPRALRGPALPAAPAAPARARVASSATTTAR